MRMHSTDIFSITAAGKSLTATTMLGPVCEGGGDTRYITHLEAPILQGGAPVAIVRGTRYDAEQARLDGTAHAWIAQEGAYLHSLRPYLFKPGVTTAVLPDWLRSVKSTHAHKEVLVIDGLEVKVGAKAPLFGAVSSVLELSPSSPVVLIHDWTSFGLALGLYRHEITPFLLGLGFTPVDGDVAMLFRDNYVQL